MVNQQDICIQGACEHNLQHVSLTIPRNSFTVITGLSGSGKSSLAFDTIYAEGQRRYVESLSSYARMFLGRMHKPAVESISGLSPAICIDQKSTSHNPRSTVGTVTEIYDYLRLLYARVGVAHCPECGVEIKQQTCDQVADDIIRNAEGRRAYVLAPVVRGKKGEFAKLLCGLREQGFSRVRIDGDMHMLEDEITLKKQQKHSIDVVVDRIVIKTQARSRVVEACEQASKLAQGALSVYVLPDASAAEACELTYALALACPLHGHSICELEPRDFSFNSPFGACPDCEGIGSKQTLDASQLISDPNLSINQGVLGGVVGRSNYYQQIVRAVVKYMGESTRTPWNKLSPKTQSALIYGLGDTKIDVSYHTLDGRNTQWQATFKGLRAIILEKLNETTSETMRAHFAKMLRRDVCPTCKGARLKPAYLAVTVGDKNIIEFCDMSCAQAKDYLDNLHFSDHDALIAQPICKEISARLEFMVHVGLDYLTLSRSAHTLSGGEAQRIRLATQIGSGLVGVLYILDEPSIGLHQRDNDRLIETLKRLRDMGNTVIVVEHDEDTIRAADWVVDMGPGAGSLGGHVVCAGTPKDIAASKESLTGAYLRGDAMIPVPAPRRKPKKGSFTLIGATAHNLKDVDLTIDYGLFTVVTGVSGSGKSSLIEDTLSKALANEVYHTNYPTGPYIEILGLKDEDEHMLVDKVIDIDQSPIGRTPRSNPATYIGLWDDLRDLFSSLPESKARGYGKGRFSFNVPGGRCEVCKGDGQLKIEMNFLPDVFVPCEACQGKRYNNETLAVTYKGKTIADVLDMTVFEALEFFAAIPKIKRKLDMLSQVGLGYIHLGQSSTTLSGGEAQRIKLAKELHRVQTGKTIYILDEPTCGLHFEDVRMLICVLQALVDAGNTVIVIEHNLDVIKVADRIIDLGPEGGDKGGYIVAEGTPEAVCREPKSYTGRYLARYLAHDSAKQRSAKQ